MMTDEKKDQTLRAIAASPVKPGQAWRHYKGGDYVVHHVGLLEATLEPVVVYGDRDGTIWVRPLESFLGTVPRFSPAAEAVKAQYSDHPMNLCKNCGAIRNRHQGWAAPGEAMVACGKYQPLLHDAETKPSVTCSRCCKQPATRECVMRSCTWRFVCEPCFDLMGDEQYLYVGPECLRP